MNQSAMFFESGLTMDPYHGTGGNDTLPSTQTAGAVLLYTDYLTTSYVGDHPRTATALWGMDTEEYAYWNIPVPLVRTIKPGSPLVTSNNNPNPGQGPMEPQQSLRSGRGYNVLMNRGAPAEKLLQEWRMHRPYRRP